MLTSERIEAIRDQVGMGPTDACEALDTIDSLKEVLRAYVRDENRFNKGEGEPFGSISTETGILARSLIK